MEPWVYWLALALVLFAVDIVVAGGASGILLVLALMALAGVLAALLGLDVTAQLAFAAVSGLVFIPLVIVIMRRITGRREGQHSDGRLADETYTVQQEADRLVVKALGDVYPVKAEAGSDTTLQPGTAVRILRFEGITAIVRPEASSAPEGPAEKP
ncbi:MAG: hypothetical protein LAT62_08770 [Natronospirillum sp.]|uniref:NfeD family protein n=1 Tax=Natronospirillum sp. TaxID=2812955 RepID=UPI0025EA4DEA|nr:NfeD family protein [Natronospirillum sp.]MCH8552014.1 hypothetical protein [Natronospirillum sp.]